MVTPLEHFPGNSYTWKNELEKQIEDMGEKKEKIIRKSIETKESENLNALVTGKDPDDVQ